MRILLTSFGILGIGIRGFGGLEEGFEVRELGGPEEAVIVEPVVDRAKWLGVKVVVAVATDAVFANEASAAEKAKVLGDGGAGYGEGACDLPGGLMAVAEEVEYGAAGGVGQGAEDGIGGRNEGVGSHNA
jgi:hypothetical protein